jgi:hypothetical protein
MITAWQATLTQRWHTNPHLAHSGDSNAGHAGRVALLAVLLFPSRPQLHTAAILHDLGEAAVGDMNGEAKRRSPVLAGLLHDMEREAIAAMGIRYPTLTEADAAALALCDRLDAWLWMMHRAPQLKHRADWLDMAGGIVALAWKCGKGEAVEQAMEGAGV